MMIPASTNAVAYRPNVECGYPVPIANASVMSVTSRSDETMRPTPARRSRGAYRPAPEKTSTSTTMRNGSHFSSETLQSSPHRIGREPRYSSRRTSAR